MKTLVIYATKYGATKKIGEIIAKNMEDATLHDINTDSEISISGFDCVILGSPLTAGTIRKEIKQFALKNAEELKAKRMGLFLSGLQESGEAQYFEQNFPAELLEAVKAKAFLGGIFDPKKCGLIARTVIKTVAKLDKYTSTIDEEKIRLFANQLAV